MAFLGFHSHGGTPKKAGLFQGKSLEIALLDGLFQGKSPEMDDLGIFGVPGSSPRLGNLHF